MAPLQESKRVTDLRNDGNNGQNMAASRTGRDSSVKAGPGISKPHGSKSRDDQYYPTAYIALPGDSKMPLAMSGGAFELSSQIRASCVEYVECEQEDTAIRVTGKSPAHVQAAVRDINDAIRGLRTKEATGHTHLLVQPPGTPVYTGGVITLHSDGASKQGTRPQLRPGGQGVAAPNPKFTSSVHEEKIVDLFRDAMSRLQAMGCNLKMRANFGFVKLHPQRSDPSEYDLNHFAAISDTLRGRAAPTFDPSFGTGVNGNKMLEHLISTFSASTDVGTSTELDRDVYHTVTLVSSDTYIEATITHATDKHGDSRQRLTNVEMFRRRNWNTLDLFSASPHMRHDWHLEVATRDPVRPSPPWLDDLKQRVFLSAPPTKDVLSHNPRLRIGAIPELRDRIDTTTLKTSVRVRYPNTSYEINVSVTRKWTGTDTGIRSDPVCTVSMRGVSWDERMTSMGSWKQGNWEPELAGVFSEGEKSFRDGLVNFVQCVKRLQGILGEVHPGDAVLGSP